MTRFTVVWHREAVDELAQIWLDAANRQAVRSAADRVDRELAVDAPAKGTPIPDRLRQFLVPPLRVIYAVSEDDRLVRILEVGLS